ncbi:MAG: hypothetical protein APF80_06310 [Alphaproteobacteria bacterium BRH_c36]|nr:MAG: hypothetical protein APF80_06310 [Alphaproteobacteria bacterium BRH_c36]
MEDRTRDNHLENIWPEIEKMVAGLNDGMPEAFEMLGVTLSKYMKTLEQTDMYMAVVFELLPFDTQQKMLADPRVETSTTVLASLKRLRS